MDHQCAVRAKAPETAIGPAAGVWREAPRSERRSARGLAALVDRVEEGPTPNAADPFSLVGGRGAVSHASLSPTPCPSSPAPPPPSARSPFVRAPPPCAPCTASTRSAPAPPVSWPECAADVVRAVQHIPFDYDNKPVFGAKVAAYLLTGFAIPFVAAYYQR